MELKETFELMISDQAKRRAMATLSSAKAKQRIDSRGRWFVLGGTAMKRIC
jgi:hypothetical protein